MPALPVKFVGILGVAGLLTNLVPVAAYTYASYAVVPPPALALTAIAPALWASASVTLSLKRILT